MMKSMQREIKIAAAIIQDEHNKTLLVRKSGTKFFMQAGGKIETSENAIDALKREIFEELGANAPYSNYIGTFSAPAANEPGHIVVAEVFSVTLDKDPIPTAEIEEIIWLDPADYNKFKIAPLSRLLLEQVSH